MENHTKMITGFSLIETGIKNENKISFEDAVYENVTVKDDKNNNSDKYKLIKKKIKVNGKTVNITLAFDKDNNLVIPTKYKKAGTRKNANVQK